jgi:hypothetical protein
MLEAIRSFFLALQDLHRLGWFFKPLSAKKSCSPALKTNEYSVLEFVHPWASRRSKIAGMLPAIIALFALVSSGLHQYRER